MASSKEYLDFILEQLSGLEENTYRAMMGEYILYDRGRIVGGIYDDRLLVKPVKSALSLLPTANLTAEECPGTGSGKSFLCSGIFLDFLILFLYNPNRIWYCHRVVSGSACLHIVRSWKMCKWGLVFYVWRIYEKTDSLFFTGGTYPVEQLCGADPGIFSSV